MGSTTRSTRSAAACSDVQLMQGPHSGLANTNRHGCIKVWCSHLRRLLVCCRRYLFVDEVNRLLLVSTADKSAYLYDLAAGAVPLAR